MGFLPSVRKTKGKPLADPVRRASSWRAGLPLSPGASPKTQVLLGESLGGLGGQLLSFGTTFWAKGSSVWILLASKIKGKMLEKNHSTLLLLL